MAEPPARVTIVQRSPCYIVAAPARDRMANLLPAALMRWKHILLTILLYRRARRRPQRVAKWIREQAGKALPPGYPVEQDFSPRYNPWDQRLCLIPDGDLFEAISSGKVAIATGEIERFVPEGLLLKSGEMVAAAIIVTATGLNMRLLGGIDIEVDGGSLSTAECIIYKGMMLSGVPNLFVAFGYANASWTLRSDLTARSACRLIRRMDGLGVETATAIAPATIGRKPVLDLTSGYVTRAAGRIPAQGDRQPWQVPQNYLRDLVAMSFARIDEAIQFETRTAQ